MSCSSVLLHGQQVCAVGGAVGPVIVKRQTVKICSSPFEVKTVSFFHQQNSSFNSNHLTSAYWKEKPNLYLHLYIRLHQRLWQFGFVFLSVSTWLKNSWWMAKAWKIKHSFWQKEHQTEMHSVSRFFFFFFFKFWNWKHLGERCITYLNTTRHISVCLNIPIYSKTVSALLKWIMDGKSRHWVISYDTIMFCLCQHVSLSDCYNLAGASWAWLTDILRPRLAPRLSYLQLVK